MLFDTLFVMVMIFKILPQLFYFHLLILNDMVFMSHLRISGKLL